MTNVPNVDAVAFEVLNARGAICTSAETLYALGIWEDYGDVPEDAPAVSISAFDGDVSADIWFDGTVWNWAACGIDPPTGKYVDASGKDGYLFGAVREIRKHGPFFGSEMDSALYYAQRFGAYAVAKGAKSICEL